MMAIRNISDGKKIYLTFDDGPSPWATRRILQVLKDENVLASFFLVAERALAHQDILREILSAGHTIGNHSFDHTYGAFFASQKKIDAWIQLSKDRFSELHVETIGFRPPAGVVTPPLKRALKRLQEPLILWTVRFYDAVFPWTPSRARRSLKKTPMGAIILLHDSQPPSRVEAFCETLKIYIRAAKEQGFEFGLLTAELCRKQSFD
jgi:peptidoglycan/xylan/chitin deacetylase (PgdA/CDA1 family)